MPHLLVEVRQTNYVIITRPYLEMGLGAAMYINFDLSHARLNTLNCAMVNSGTDARVASVLCAYYTCAC